MGRSNATMKVLSWILICLALAVGFTGCERQADSANPVHFKEGTLAFDYPANWKVTSNDPLGEGRLVILGGPGSVLVTIAAFSPGVAVSLEDYGRMIKENMTDSALGILLRMKPQEGHTERESMEFRFTVSIGSVHVPHTQVLTRHVFGDATLFCMSQVADEDRHLVQAGFDLVRDSLNIMNPGSVKH